MSHKPNMSLKKLPFIYNFILNKSARTRTYFFIFALIFLFSFLFLFVKATPWDVSTASYSPKVNFSVASQTTYPKSLFFKSDGTKMYVTGFVSNLVYQYSLSTPWQVSTASYDNKNFNISSQISNPYGLFFKSDGTKMYTVSSDNSRVYQYTLSTPWDVSTASYSPKVNFSVASQESYPTILFFKSDGTKMYVYAFQKVFQYNLSTPWQVSTASYDNKNFNISSQMLSADGLFFKSDGTKMYVLHYYLNDTIYQYSLSTAWDISTTSYSPKVNISIASQSVDSTSLFFKSDGTKMYVLDTTSHIIFQYSLDIIKPILTITSPANSTYATTTINFNVTATDNVGMSSCRYSFNTGTKNYSMTNNSATTWGNKNSTMTQGHKTVTYYCNDTSDNINSTSRQFTVDSINPSVTSLTEPTDPATYVYGRSYKFNATVTDTHLSVVKLEFNNINHTASNVGGNTYGFTLSGLSVGGPYSYRWYANDTFGNSNNTQTGSYTINKASPSSNMAITGTTPITYLTTSAFTSSETNNGDGSCSYSTDKSNKIYGVGTWTFNYSTAGCTNYSSGSVTKDLVINKAIPTADFTNNKAWTREYDGTNNTIGISESNTGDTDVTYVIFRGGVSQGASDSWGSIGAYTYKINTTGGGNYSDVFNLNTNTLTIQDTTKPKPKMVYPLNSTYATNVSTLTYTYTELLPSRCWYSKNNGVTNSTSVACGTNFSNIVSTEGTNKWILYMNDTTGNENSTSKTFFKDSIYPKISMVSPANNTNSSNTGLDIKYKYTEINCRNVTWNENSGANTTLASCGTNITTPTWGQGKHNFTIFIRDIGNNLNKTYVSFKIDTTLPVVTISSPSNNTITKDTTLDIKYTYTEINCKNVTWQDGTGSNTTLASCGTNITTPTWGQGKHNVTVFMRDWSNNLGKKSVSFRIDTTKPILTITNPTNSSYATTTIPFNVTATDNIGMSSCRYSFNTGTKNYTMTNYTATKFSATNTTMTQGHKTVTYYCNDTSDNINSTSRQFTVDNVYPKISMVSPANNTNSSDAGLDVKYKYTEINCHNVTWQDGIGSNTTLASCGTNITTPTWGQGKHNVTVFIRDWSNQLNKTYVSFRIDTTNPTSALITPSNNTKTSGTIQNLTVSLDDNQGIKNSTLKIYNSTNNLINTTTTKFGSNVISKIQGIYHTFIAGTYKWLYQVFDWAGNSGVSGNNTLIIDTAVPSITITNPTNSSYAITTIPFNVTAIDVNGISTCRYSFTAGAKNYTMTNYTATKFSATNTTMTQGHKKVTYYCNDTADNIANTQITFFVDSIYPKISMVSPANNTNSSDNGLDIKYTYTEINCANTTWNDGGGSNTTLASCGTNVTIPTWGQGKHNVTVFMRDWANNLNKTYVSFRIDSINPQIAYDAETAANYANLSQNSVYTNVTLIETNFKNITYTLRNKTATLNTTTFTTVRKHLNFTKGIRDDNYTYFVNVTDTLSNKNSTAIRHLTLDTTNPIMTIHTANNTATASGSLTISINFTATDTNRKKCYFTLRTPGGLLHNYAENTSMSCTTTPKAITALYFGKFVVQFWAEDYTGNLGDANLTFTTTAIGGGGGGGGGPPISPVEEKPEVTKTFCGDNVCQSTGNDYGIKEDYYSCQIDCPGFNFDALIFSFTKYCWDKDPSTICIFGTLFGVENAEVNVTSGTTYKDGQVCKGDVCENLGGKTLTYNCFVGKPCFFASGTGAITSFIAFFSLVAISLVKVDNPAGKGKVSSYSWIKIKMRRKRR